MFIVETKTLFFRATRRDHSFNNQLMSAMSPVNSWQYVGYSYDYNTGLQKLYINDKEVTSSNIGKSEIATQYQVQPTTEPTNQFCIIQTQTEPIKCPSLSKLLDRPLFLPSSKFTMRWLLYWLLKGTSLLLALIFCSSNTII